MYGGKNIVWGYRTPWPRTDLTRGANFNVMHCTHSSPCTHHGIEYHMRTNLFMYLTRMLCLIALYVPMSMTHRLRAPVSKWIPVCFMIIRLWLGALMNSCGYKSDCLSVWIFVWYIKLSYMSQYVLTYVFLYITKYVYILYIYSIIYYILTLFCLLYMDLYTLEFSETVAPRD